MKVEELDAQVAKHVANGDYVEAFMLRSAYMESVITAMMFVIYALERGFNGNDKSFSESVHATEQSKAQYKKESMLSLEKKIDLLEKLPAPLTVEDDIRSELHIWRKNWNAMKHEFAEKMLHGTLKDDARTGYEHLEPLFNQDWFVRMKSAFIQTDMSIDVLKKK